MIWAASSADGSERRGGDRDRGYAAGITSQVEWVRIWSAQYLKFDIFKWPTSYTYTYLNKATLPIAFRGNIFPLGLWLFLLIHKKRSNQSPCRGGVDGRVKPRTVPLLDVSSCSGFSGRSVKEKLEGAWRALTVPNYPNIIFNRPEKGRIIPLMVITHNGKMLHRPNDLSKLKVVFVFCRLLIWKLLIADLAHQ